ncbi:MAG: hypothetical protein ABL872_06100, partial [Lacibacter sp.]
LKTDKFTELSFKFKSPIKFYNMSKSLNPEVPKAENKKSTRAGKCETEILAKSGWPKTPKETIKMVINFLLNFFPF